MYINTEPSTAFSFSKDKLIPGISDLKQQAPGLS